MKFLVGCNYWGLKSGIRMWDNFDIDAIRKDFEIMDAYKIDTIRVFPLWSEFQPVKAALGVNGKVFEYIMRDGTRPTNKYYIDEKKLRDFEKFCDLCDEYNIRIIVALLTGWMSGRIFLPAALEGKNVFTDPTARYFEQKFIEGFVTYFRDRKCILSWDLGNECDALSEYGNIYLMLDWVYMVRNAIKSADNTRPVLSGMATVEPDFDRKNMWLSEQGNILDEVTVHPYPLFHPHSFSDYLLSFKTSLHGTAQGKYFSELSGKPCISEELGTLGASVCDDETDSLFLKLNLYSSWVNGLNGVLWWCFSDFHRLNYPPYTWSHLENELGLVKSDGTPKGVIREIKKFKDFYEKLDFKLPKAMSNVAIVVSGTEEAWEAWGVSFQTYVIAKQAKLNPDFIYGMSPIPKYDAYILPAVSSDKYIPKDAYLEIMTNVQNGATLYISNNDGFLIESEKFAGIRIIDSCNAHREGNFTIGEEKFSFYAEKMYKIKSVDAEVIAYDSNVNPIFTKHKYGDGNVFFLNFPLESNKMDSHSEYIDNSYMIYEIAFSDILKKRIVLCDNPQLCITEHYDKTCVYVAIINHSNETINPKVAISEEYHTEKVITGDINNIEPFDSVILKLIRKDV